MATPPRGDIVTRGDQTGRIGAELRAENAEAIKEASKRMAMVTAVKEYEQDHVVYDYTGSTPVPETETIEVADGKPKKGKDKDPLVEAVVAKAKAAETPEPQEVGGVEPVTPKQVGAEDDTRVIVALYDLENVTVGAGTLYNFEAGRKYRVPKNVAFHLGQKNVVREV